MGGQEIRKAHFVFGSDPKDYCTTNSLDFATMNRGSTIKSVNNFDLRSSHIPLSNDPMLKESVSRMTYVKHSIDGGQLNTDRSQYLHGTHFNMGNGNFDALPEYKVAYVNKGFAQNKIDEAKAKDIRDSHIGYIFKQGPGRLLKTTYQERISDLTKGRIPTVDRDHKDLHRTNFLMGIDKTNYDTEMKSKYVDHGIADFSARDFARRSNAPSDIGLTGKVDYTTESKAQFTGPTPDYKALGFSKEFSKDLRKQHFEFGSEPKEMVTDYQLYFTEKQRDEAKFNEAQLKDMKSSHFDLGGKGEIGITHYVDQHRWLQPVPKEVE